jgi:hypothetical protein
MTVVQRTDRATAAERMFLTPSGLSVLIRELERQLGFRLFDRTTRRVSLTGYGSDLLGASQPTLKTLDTAMFRIKQAAKGRTRWISVGTTPWMAANVCRRRLKHSPAPAGFAGPALRRKSGHCCAARRSGKTGLGVGNFRKDAGGMRSTIFSLFSNGGPPGQECGSQPSIDQVDRAERGIADLSDAKNASTTSTYTRLDRSPESKVAPLLLSFVHGRICQSGIRQPE